MVCFEKSIGHEANSHLANIVSGSGNQALPFVAVGTMFMDLDEVFPTRGRIVIYEITLTKGLVQRHL